MLSVVHAAPATALGVTAGLSSADQSLTASGRLRWESGLQLGLQAQMARISTGFVDGYEVQGAKLATTLGLTVPLVRLETVQVDLEVELGMQGLRPEAGSQTEDLGLALITDLAPMVTIPTGDRFALRLGWEHLLHSQISPSLALDAQGALIRAEGVLALNEDLQLSLGGSTGGVFGFGGDGGKYLIGAQVGLRWLPGAARTWKNL